MCGQGKYAFLTNRVVKYISSTRFWPKGKEKDASIFVIQLRNPDYWILLVCRTHASNTVLLFDGKWNEAVDFFSVPGRDFPDPEFVAFSGEKKDSSLFEIARETLTNVIIGFPNVLLSGHSSEIIYSTGIMAFHDVGVLTDDDVSPLYFESFLTPQETKTEPVVRVPFDPAEFERKAFYCRFPRISGSEEPTDEFKGEIHAILNHDSFSPHASLRRELIWNDVKLIILGNGHLIADSRHQIKALEALNTFLAYSFLKGSGTAPANLQDIGSLTIKIDGTVKSWTTGLGAIRKTRLLRDSLSVSDVELLVAGFVVDINEELGLEMRLLHLACFHFVAGEYLQSFSLAWIVVERRVSSLWRTTLEHNGYAGSRLDELSDSDRYSMSVMIDMLELLSVVTPDVASKLHTLRKARNKASHEGKIPPKEETMKCLNLAVQFVQLVRSGLTVDLLTLGVGAA